MKKALYTLLLLLVLFVIYLLINTFTFKSKQVKFEQVASIEIEDTSVTNFIEALKIKTISPEDIANFDSTSFQTFSDFLAKTYPLSDSLLNKKTFNNYSFLYKWKGTDDHLKPVILMAHLDVVPAIKENLSDWKAQPFSGKVINDTIWGRGAIDDKISVIGLLESTELLLKQGYKPKRTIYFAFGHDEEIGGEYGAKTIANYLKSQNVTAEYVLDEGGSFTRNLVPDIKQDVALIGIAEKGFLSLKLSTNIEGGHSSMPEKESAIDVLASAVSKLKNNPLPSKITPPIEGFITHLGPEMPFVNKLVFANSGIFNPVIRGIYEKKSSSNALVRTTTSPTLFHSGIKDNVIPKNAYAVVNFRLLPGDNYNSIYKHVSTTINDKRINIDTSGFYNEPSAVSSTDSMGFKTVHQTIVQLYPNALVSPYLVVGATDSRHFKDITNNIYRFLPIIISDKNIKSFHGVNERIAISDYKNAINFYVQLIKNSQE